MPSYALTEVIDGVPLCSLMYSIGEVRDLKNEIAWLNAELHGAELDARRTCRNLAEPDGVYDRPFTCSECGASGPYGEGTYHLGKTETVGKELAEALGVAEGSMIHSDSWSVWKYCPCCGAKVVEYGA